MDNRMCVPRFMLDRDQIFYSKAFRRLAGKAQVFVTGQGEELRNRLTHTLEVSQIARSIAQSLGLDLDLVEAIALGHDLGHTPFGHAGERILHEIMTPGEDHALGKNCPLCVAPEQLPRELLRFLGFKHNLQGVVVAMELEKNYRDWGLNLTAYTNYGIQAHSGSVYSAKRMKNHNMLGFYDEYLERGCKENGADAWSLEALLVAQADEIAQYHHDMEDAVLSGMMTPAELVALMKPLLGFLDKPLSEDEAAVISHPENCDPDMFLYLFTRIVVDLMMRKLTETAAERIEALGGVRALDVRAWNTGNNSKMAHVFRAEHTPEEDAVKKIFLYDGDFAAAVDVFPTANLERVLRSRRIRYADEGGQHIIRDIFRYYYDNPEMLPDEWILSMLGRYYDLVQAGEPEAYCRPEFASAPETEQRQNGDVRKVFRKIFADREHTTQAEELLLMRAICNYVACMTDDDARKTWHSIYG